MIDIFNFLEKRNREHHNVGRIFYSRYFDKLLVVTAYNRDEKWHFKFLGEEKEIKAQSSFDYMVDQGLERKNI